MQIVPAFAYLMPVVILFSVGPAAAVICTLIYAIPPAVRITALGIRGVTAESVEASQAFGATPTQTLAEGAAPAGAPPAAAGAEPDDHVRALARRDRRPDRRPAASATWSPTGSTRTPALALLAGIAIVIMAIALDRATAAIADRTDPTRRQLTDEGRRRARRITLATFGLIAVIVIVARALGVDSIYPDEFETSTTVYDANIQSTILGWINDALDYIQDPSSFIFGITEPIGNFILEKLLEPLQHPAVGHAVVHRDRRRHRASPSC